MNSHEDKVRTAIAEQAGEWFVANEEGPLDARDSAALAAWLKVSPVHVEEFLGVSAIVRDLKEAGIDPEYSLKAILARARAEDKSPVGQPSRRWLTAAVAVAACAVLSVGLLLFWNVRTNKHLSAPDGITALHLETRHGEQLTRRLADNSVVHLNTDSAVTIRYGRTERLVTLSSGQAEFDVAHDPARAFRVIAGSAEVVDLGTRFDVRLEHGETVVTVVEGRVAVGPSDSRRSQFVQLGADQQLSVAAGEWPSTPIAIDAQSATAWLRREIVFDHEPLALVAAEYNRYTGKPIEIATPALRTLQISGVFATDDIDAFIAFLRSLKGVRVEVTATEVRVSRD
jgi:transmembrane sensor